ncbi:MAG: hypothetical protein KA954_01275 [Chitinophagales bacterium]|nr:hypothetical protein [Chitinophagales bacterium]MBP9845836.1 hypothetical protein [Saprospiraceae bacterium]
MASILELKRKIESLDIIQVSVDAITKTDAIAADLQVKQQLNGVDAKGQRMPNYSPISVELYGKPDGPIILKDTGSFQRKITVKALGDKIVFSSSDDKTQMLEERYGKKGFSILGLNSDTKKEWKEDLQPNLIDIVKKKTGL